MFTLPKLIVLVLALRVGTNAFKCSCTAADPPFATAVTSAVEAEDTAEMLAVKVALVAFFATDTVAGTTTAALLLVRLTNVPVREMPLRLTVQLSVPPPTSDVALHVRVLGISNDR
jgi:dihydrodipicolinate synthase/N-acetylneuraminate lyase